MKTILKHIWLIVVLLSIPFSCKHTRQLTSSVVTEKKDSAVVKNDNYKSNVFDSIMNAFSLKSISASNNTQMTIERYNSPVNDDATDNTPIEIKGNFKLASTPHDSALNLVDSATGKQIIITNKGVTVKDPQRHPKIIPYERITISSNTSINNKDSSGTNASKHASVIDTSKHDSAQIQADVKQEQKKVNSIIGFMNNPLIWIALFLVAGAVIYFIIKKVL